MNRGLLVDRLQERTCGVYVVHLGTGQVVAFLNFTSGVKEIFAVRVLRGRRQPELRRTKLPCRLPAGLR